MILKAIVDDQVYTLNVPDQILQQGEDFFDQLDRDMDQGWQMSREWVDRPDRLQRCQIIADKLLSALEKENERLGMMMAGYIVARLPNVDAVEFDLQGEIQNNQFRFREASPDTPTELPTGTSPSASSDQAEGSRMETEQPPTAPSTNNPSPTRLGKMEAMAQAGQDVTKVFKVGKAWRFSVFDHASQSWQDAPLIATEQEAERLRQAAFKARYEALIGTAP
jgi:hypothetical protein